VDAVEDYTEREDDCMILVVRTDGSNLPKHLFTTSTKYVYQIQKA
jgi:hypothetical protein